MVRVYIKSLGCKVNQAESEEMMKILSRAGAQSTDNENDADVCIINTCTVTQRADADSRNAVRRAVKNNSSCRVIVAGCYSKLYPEKVISIQGVNAVTGNSAKKNIAEILADVLSEKNEKKIIQCEEDESVFIASSHAGNSSRTRAFLKIQDGCDSACTYCIVPRARGKSRSGTISDSENAFRKLIDEGFREVVLTGIHLGDFGSHGGNRESLEKLLEKLILTQGNYRIRLSSIEPREISDRLLEIIASSDRITPHLHIPLQSGDDGILSAMNRNYNSTFFKNLVNSIWSKINDINIGFDVITGFPGESDEQFKNTFSFIERLPAGYLHVFPYSDRQGTKASEFAKKISPQVIKERAGILRELGKKKKEEFRKKFLGRNERVLVERVSKKGRNVLMGLTDNYIPVIFNSNGKTGKNDFAQVQLTKLGKNEIVEGETNC